MLKKDLCSLASEPQVNLRNHLPPGDSFFLGTFYLVPILIGFHAGESFFFATSTQAGYSHAPVRK
jgi:hypothetical protein